MRLRNFSRNEKQVTFEIIEDNTLANWGYGLIVVNLNESDPIQAYRKQMIADHLDMIAQDNRYTDWREVDRIIERIMNCKIHWL